MTLCCVEVFHIVVAQHLRPRHSASRSRLQYQRWWTLCHSMMEKRAPRTGYPWHLEHSNVCKVNGSQWGGLGERVTVTGKCSVYTYVILVSHIVVHSRDVQYFRYLRFSLLKNVLVFIVLSYLKTKSYNYLPFLANIGICTKRWTVAFYGVFLKPSVNYTTCTLCEMIFNLSCAFYLTAEASRCRLS